MSHYAGLKHPLTKCEAENADEETARLIWTPDESLQHISGKPRTGQRNFFVNALRFSLEAVLCFLLLGNAVFVLQGAPIETAKFKSVTFQERSYGNDIEYMSLDHKYDWLWEEEMSGSAGLI